MIKLAFAFLDYAKKTLHVIRQNLILFYSIGWEDKQKDDTETFRSAIKTVLQTPAPLKNRFLQALPIQGCSYQFQKYKI